MEITNDIKATIFAPYWGKPFKNGIGNRCAMSFFDLADIAVGKIKANLILKPLSALTAEDAKRVIKFEYPHQTIKDISVDNGCITFKIKLSYSYVSKVISFQSLTFEQGQYLQSTGYDLPNYLLGNKTLHEAGLAIYE